MKRIAFTAGVALLLAAAAAFSQETIVLRAWTIGPEDASITRSTNLEAAAEGLNAALEVENEPYRVRVDAAFESDSWVAHRRRILLGFESGKVADIVQSAHVDIAPWSDAGYLLELDPHISRHAQFEQIHPKLWDSVTYNGRIWGIPQDTEARPLYFNKKLLAKLGYSDGDIAALPERIRIGAFTWEDLFDVGKKAVEAGVVSTGHAYWHRPSNGADFCHLYYTFGGKLQDPESGRLVFSRAAARDMYDYFARAAEDGLIKRDLIGTSWKEWHRAVTNDRVLFVSAGTWTWAQWATEYVKDRGGYEHLWDTFGFALQPAARSGGRPGTLSQPQAYVVWSRSPHTELAVRLLAFATDPELDLAHALGSAHLAALSPTVSLPDYRADEFASRITYMLDYTTFQPLHSGLGQFMEIFFRGLSAVESGQFSSAEAVDIVSEELQRALRNEVIIR